MFKNVATSLAINIDMDTVFIKEEIATVCELHPESRNFKKLVGEVTEDFEYWRNCKGDGNCFYRAVGAALLEYHCTQETQVEGFRGLLSNLYHQQFPIKAETGSESIIRSTKVVLRVFYSLLKFKESQPGYLPHLLDKLLNCEQFMLPFIEVLRHLAAEGAVLAFQGTGLLDDESAIREMGRAASEEDIKGLACALGCGILQVEMGTADYAVRQTLIDSGRNDDFQLHVLLSDRHYSALLPRMRIRTLPRLGGLKGMRMEGF